VPQPRGRPVAAYFATAKQIETILFDSGHPRVPTNASTARVVNVSLYEEKKVLSDWHQETDEGELKFSKYFLQAEKMNKLFNKNSFLKH